MRHVLTLTICGALAAPFAASAQPAPDLTPPEAFVPAAPPPEPPSVDFLPSKQPVLDATSPTTVQSVAVEADDKRKSKLGKKAAVTAGGVIGGLAGAAAGPVGKIAGSLVGKTIARSVVGGGKRDKADASATQVAQAAAPPATDAVAVTDTPSPADPAPTADAQDPPR